VVAFVKMLIPSLRGYERSPGCYYLTGLMLGFGHCYHGG
jgi:hypothetical protein